MKITKSASARMGEISLSRTRIRFTAQFAFAVSDDLRTRK